MFSNRCWVGYLSPFTVVVPKNEKPLSIELEDINRNTYDHGKLCGIVHSMDLGHADGLKMLICRDGAIALPMTSNHGNREDVVDFYNKLLCQLLVGGHLCEAVDTRDIVTGQLHEGFAIWPVDFGQSASSHLHSKLRMRMAGSIDSIVLASPRHIKLQDFVSRVQVGQAVLAKVKNLTPTFLIKGVTELTYRNWSAALSNLWITAEQLTDYVWHNLFVGGSGFPIPELPARTKSMHEDNRTWSVSVKQELLYSAGFLSKAEYALLFPARQARNKLVHEGKRVEEEVALDLFEAISGLLSKATDQANLLVPRKTITDSWMHGRGKKVRVKERHEEWSRLTIDGLK